MKESNGTYLFIPSHSKEVLLSHEEYFDFAMKVSHLRTPILILVEFDTSQKNFYTWSEKVFKLVIMCIYQMGGEIHNLCESQFINNKMAVKFMFHINLYKSSLFLFFFFKSLGFF